MNASTELNIKSKSCNFSFLLKSLGDQWDKTYKVQDFISRLEEERLKIDAFKRELPLCMQLLNDAMEASRQQLAACSQANHNTRPILEEFIPLKHQETPERSINGIVEATAIAAANTGSWMATTQIWSQSSDGSKNQGSAVSAEPEHGLVGSSKLALDAKHRIGGAFLPFSKERNDATQQVLRSQLPELALAPGDEPKRPETVELAVPISRIKASDQNSASQGNCNGGNGMVGGSTEKNGGNEVQAAGGGQTHRKPRRCWSPDLHRRFVNALQQLGGSQAATPKQIRELMKVDGLTNDEVKSHLQKYRLHTRRPSPTPQAMTAPAPQLVVLGSIWVSPEYTTAAHSAAPGIYSATIAAAAAAQSASPPPTHYCHPSALPQDFCTQLSTPPHHQLRHVYCDQQLTAATHNNNSKNDIVAGDKDKNNNSNSSSSSDENNNKTSSNSKSSPRTSRAGERSQSIEEEGRSESGSWRGESTENEEGREMGRALSLKRRATLRSEVEGEDGEESTGSDITLKF